MDKIEEVNLLLSESKYNQKQLAAKIACNHIHLNAILRGRRDLTQTMYIRIKYLLR